MDRLAGATGPSSDNEAMEDAPPARGGGDARGRSHGERDGTGNAPFSARARRPRSPRGAPSGAPVSPRPSPRSPPPPALANV